MITIEAQFRFTLLFILASLAAVFSVEASDAIQSTGQILQFILPAAAIGSSAWHRDGDGLIEFGESAATTLAATYGLKYAVNEKRPNGGSHSFPSGHTSISFASAEYLRKRYGWEYGVPAYAAASFVAYSRVESREHHPQDVIAGAGIGILSSYLFTKPFHGWKADLEGTSTFLGLRFSHDW